MNKKKILQLLLKLLASAVVRKYHPLVIGITGSVCKTSTRNAIEAVLRPSFSVRASIKSYNNEWGVPLTILGEQGHGKNITEWLGVLCRATGLLLRHHGHYPHILILEMGADKPGDIAYLISIASPTMGILTAIGEAHMEFFKTPKALAEEKKHIITCLPPAGLAILNSDDATVWGLRGSTIANVVSVGMSHKADFMAKETLVVYEEQNARKAPIGIRTNMHHKGACVPLTLQGMLGEGHIMSALIAYAVGKHMGLMVLETTARLKKYIPPPGRMRILHGIKHTTLIDDSYNASPRAMKMALHTLQSLNVPQGGEKWALLGDMKELGALTPEAHKELGGIAAHSNLDWLVTVGASGALIYRGAREGGIREDRAFHFTTPQEAGKFVQQKLEPHDVVLIKASRAMHFEKITQELMAEPLKAHELTVQCFCNYSPAHAHFS